jgi:cytochrome P450
MPHSLLFGHIPILAKMKMKPPKDQHLGYLPQWLCENWRELCPDQPACPPVIYADLWPVGPPVMWVLHPKAATLFFQDSQLPRHERSRGFLYPLTHNLDLVSTDGSMWRTWRSRLSPGFSAKNILNMVPAILDDILFFVDLLHRRAGPDGSWGDVFPLQEPATNLTLDVIGRAAL